MECRTYGRYNLILYYYEDKRVRSAISAKVSRIHRQNREDILSHIVMRLLEISEDAAMPYSEEVRLKIHAAYTQWIRADSKSYIMTRDTSMDDTKAPDRIDGKGKRIMRKNLDKKQD